MPQDRQTIRIALLARLVRIRQANEMEHERVQYLVRQLIFFVNQHPDEKRVGTGVVHLRYMQESCRGVKSGYLRPREDRSDNGGFFQCASVLENQKYISECKREWEEEEERTSNMGNMIPLKNAPGLYSDRFSAA